MSIRMNSRAERIKEIYCYFGQYIVLVRHNKDAPINQNMISDYYSLNVRMDEHFSMMAYMKKNFKFFTTAETVEMFNNDGMTDHLYDIITLIDRATIFLHYSIINNYKKYNRNFLIWEPRIKESLVGSFNDIRCFDELVCFLNASPDNVFGVESQLTNSIYKIKYEKELFCLYRDENCNLPDTLMYKGDLINALTYLSSVYY